MVRLSCITLVMLLLLCASELKASECYVQKLTIARHVDVNISTSSVDRALSEASLLLRLKASANDYSCCVQLVREGPVDVFGVAGDGRSEVKNASQLREVWHISNHMIKVVKSIDLPAHLGIFGPSEPKDGQAYPGLTMVVTEGAHPVIWAHEFGHFKHIWSHRDDSMTNIMNSYASDVGEISQGDCQTMQDGGIPFVNRPEITGIRVVEPTGGVGKVEILWKFDLHERVTTYKLYYQINKVEGDYNGTGISRGASPIDLGKVLRTIISADCNQNVYFFKVSAVISGIETPVSGIFATNTPSTPDNFKIIY